MDLQQPREVPKRVKISQSEVQRERVNNGGNNKFAPLWLKSHGLKFWKQPLHEIKETLYKNDPRKVRISCDTLLDDVQRAFDLKPWFDHQDIYPTLKVECKHCMDWSPWLVNKLCIQKHIHTHRHREKRGAGDREVDGSFECGIWSKASSNSICKMQCWNSLIKKIINFEPLRTFNEQ